MTGALYLIRHGATKLNEGPNREDRIRGWLDPPLIQAGKDQAVADAAKLKDKGITRVYSSNLQRAGDTAKTIADTLDVPVEDSIDFRPWNLGDLQGDPAEQVAAKLRHYAENPDEKVPGGESFNEFKNRYLDAFTPIYQATQDGKTLAIVTHYRDIKLTQAWLADDEHGIDLDEFFTDDLKPGDIIVLSDGEWTELHKSAGTVTLRKRDYPELVSKADSIEAQIAAVAETVAPDGGYGGAAWNPEKKTVFWQCADWTSNDEHDAAEAAFLAIPGVDHFDCEAEAALPEGDGWEIVCKAYPVLVRAHVRGGNLDAGVGAELQRFLDSHPDIRAGEAAEHGFDPVSDPARYLAAERAEGYHDSLNESAPVDLQRIRDWEAEEQTEYDKIAKDNPTSTDVHVDAPMGDISAADLPAGKKKRKLAKVEDSAIAVVKVDDERRIVYGIVLEPNVEDSQGDVVSKEDVELAAHRFLYGNAPIGIQHGRLAPDTVKPVESYIAPADFMLGGQVVKAGSWVLATHVPDDALWQQVKKEGFGSYSVAGTGKRSPLP